MDGFARRDDRSDRLGPRHPRHDDPRRQDRGHDARAGPTHHVVVSGLRPDRLGGTTDHPRRAGHGLHRRSARPGAARGPAGPSGCAHPVQHPPEPLLGRRATPRHGRRHHRCPHRQARQAASPGDGRGRPVRDPRLRHGLLRVRVGPAARVRQRPPRRDDRRRDPPDLGRARHDGRQRPQRIAEAEHGAHRSAGVGARAPPRSGRVAPRSDRADPRSSSTARPRSTSI